MTKKNSPHYYTLPPYLHAGYPHSSILILYATANWKKMRCKKAATSCSYQKHRRRKPQLLLATVAHFQMPSCYRLTHPSQHVSQRFAIRSFLTNHNRHSFFFSKNSLTPLWTNSRNYCTTHPPPFTTPTTLHAIPSPSNHHTDCVSKTFHLPPSETHLPTPHKPPNFSAPSPPPQDLRQFRSNTNSPTSSR